MTQNSHKPDVNRVLNLIFPPNMIPRAAIPEASEEFEATSFDSSVEQDGLERSLGMLREATRCLDREDWNQSESLADAVIELAPNMPETYMVRGRARRNTLEFLGAVEDYTRALELDPQNPNPLMLRGAARMDQASFQDDYGRALQIMICDALPDFQMAAKLSPDDFRIGLSILEVEVCTGRYRDGGASAGIWWNRTSYAWKAVCAWLGGLALIMAGRPERRWSKFRDWLASDKTPAVSDYWNTLAVDRFLKHLEASGCDRGRMRKLSDIHELFLSRHTA